MARANDLIIHVIFGEAEQVGFHEPLRSLLLPCHLSPLTLLPLSKGFWHQELG
jgi:hypothetical protein